MRVTYDRNGGTFDKLLKRASQKRCDLFVWTTTDKQLAAAKRVVGNRAQHYAAVPDRKSERLDKEQQYYLYKSPLRYVPMTIAQRTRANAAIRGGGKAWRQFLSPRQLGWLAQIQAAPKKKWPVAQGETMADAIAAFTKAAEQDN